MDDQLADLRDEKQSERFRAALTEQIRSAFAGVSRENGVSWSETFVRDAYGTEAECAKARASDTERSWDELLRRTDWNPFPGTGGFNFVDAIGFRYYLPAAMTYCLRTDEWQDISFFLHNRGDLMSLFSDDQLLATKRFVGFMLADARRRGARVEAVFWEDVWRAWNE
jgi:hypothetical protein